MKLFLINPFFKEDTERFAYQISVPPLSLCFIGTYIKNYSTNCDVEIIDPILQRLNKNQVLKKVEEADFVGLTCYTYNRHQCFDFGEELKETNPYCKLIVGGAHVNELDEKILKYYPFIDVVCWGEGEEILLEITKGKPFKDITGITWRNNGEIVRNPDRPFIENIDDLYCDFSLLPDFDRYIPDPEVSKEIKALRTAHLVVSRGCPYNCTFCGAKRWKRTYRQTSSKNVVEQIKHLVDEHGIEYVKFHDDLFTMNKQNMLKFCRLLKENKINIKFRVLSRVDTVSKEVFKALKDAGCVAVGMGIESGSDKVLQKLNKRTSTDKVLKAVEILDELNYWKIGFFMVSLPDEKREDYEKSLKLSKHFEQAYFNPLVVFPGTLIYEELKQKGEINDDFWFEPSSPEEVYYCKENFPSAEFDMQEILQLEKHAYHYHTLHCPKFVIEKRGWVKGTLSILETAIDALSQGRTGDLYIRLKYKTVYRRKYGK